MKNLLKNAKNASKNANLFTCKEKNSVLLQMADKISENKERIIKENIKDLNKAKDDGLSNSMIDRLLLNSDRIDDMANSLKTIASQEEPVGKVLKTWELEDGLIGKKVTVPIGVICIIYESRPNVTSDTAGLCFKSGNVCILKGGKEAINSNRIISSLLQEVLEENGISKDFITFIEGGREDVKKLIKMDEYIDLIIPRGGENLVKFVSENSTIPVVKHDKGLCHIYIDKSASLQKAINVSVNAKCQRTGVCNAIETMLIHEDIAKEFLPKLKEAFEKQSSILKGCEKTLKIIDIKEATKEDWDTEYLDNIISIKVVKDIDEAIEHISNHGSMHSESIISEDNEAIELFLNLIDASCVYANASTRFTDGGLFGLGAEIGISTNKLHVRGPVGASDLTTYKYKIYGKGHIRK